MSTTTTTSSPVRGPSGATIGSATQYDDVADVYDRLIRPKYDAIAALVRNAAVAAGDVSDAVVLELSAGTGALTRQLAPEVTRGYIATDVSAPMLAVARQRCAGPIAWLRAGVEDIPLPTGIADVVASSLGPVQDSEDTLAEALRVLTSGGRLVACTWGDDYAELDVMQAARTLLDLEPRPVTTADEIAGRARGAGFRDVEVTAIRLPVVHASLDHYTAYRSAFGAVPLPDGLTTTDLLDALRTAATPYVDAAGRVVLDWHLLVLTAKA